MKKFLGIAVTAILISGCEQTSEASNDANNQNTVNEPNNAPSTTQGSINSAIVDINHDGFEDTIEFYHEAEQIKKLTLTYVGTHLKFYILQQNGRQLEAILEAPSDYLPNQYARISLENEDSRRISRIDIHGRKTDPISKTYWFANNRLIQIDRHQEAATYTTRYIVGESGLLSERLETTSTGEQRGKALYTQANGVLTGYTFWETPAETLQARIEYNNKGETERAFYYDEQGNEYLGRYNFYVNGARQQNTYNALGEVTGQSFYDQHNNLTMHYKPTTGGRTYVPYETRYQYQVNSNLIKSKKTIWYNEQGETIGQTQHDYSHHPLGFVATRTTFEDSSQQPKTLVSYLFDSLERQQITYHYNQAEQLESTYTAMFDLGSQQYKTVTGEGQTAEGLPWQSVSTWVLNEEGNGVTHTHTYTNNELTAQSIAVQNANEDFLEYTDISYHGHSTHTKYSQYFYLPSGEQDRAEYTYHIDDHLYSYGTIKYINSSGVDRIDEEYSDRNGDDYFEEFRVTTYFTNGSTERAYSCDNDKNGTYEPKEATGPLSPC